MELQVLSCGSVFKAFTIAMVAPSIASLRDSFHALLEGELEKLKFQEDGHNHRAWSSHQTKPYKVTQER